MAGELVDDLRDIIETERARFEVPGCAVLVVRDGAVVMCEGFGVRDIDQDLQVTARTLFPIASSTKTFTAALCALLVEEGVLAWDRPVRDYLPELRMLDRSAAEQVTVVDLLCHRSGLPRHDLLWYLGRDELTHADLVAALGHLKPNRGFREVFQYNNILYTVVGELAGRLDGTSYEDAVRNYLLQPLGMRRTNFSVDDTQADDDAARPYVSPEVGEPVKEVPFARLDIVSPAGGINSCVEDLVSWLLTLLGHGVPGAPPLLRESTLSLMRTPAMPLLDGSLLAGGTPVGYGLGLIVEDYRSYRTVHHGGNIDGFSSQVTVMPAARCGVVVLANRDGTSLRDALPYLIYDRVLGLESRAHGDTFLARETALRRGRAQADARVVASGLDLPAVRPLDDYVGTYRHPAYGELRITAAGDGLAAEYRSLAGRLEHRHLEVFNLVVDLGGTQTPIPMQFAHNVDGEVTAAHSLVERSVEPVRFDRVPDTDHLTDAVLDRLAGTYRLGPLVAQVERRAGGTLAARIVEGGYVALQPMSGLVFERDGTRIEFTADGRMLTPIGDFVQDTGLVDDVG